MMALNKTMQGMLSGEIAEKRAGQVLHKIALATWPYVREMRNSERMTAIRITKTALHNRSY